MSNRWIRFVAGHAPFNALRIAMFRFSGVSVGRRVKISWGVSIGFGTSVHDSVTLGRGVFIGSQVSVGRGSVIRANAHVGDGCVLGEEVVVCSMALVGNATIGDGSFIERGAIMTGFQKGRIAIGRHCYIGIGAVLDWSGGLEIGDFVHVAGPSTGIWTHSSVAEALNGKDLRDRSECVVSGVKIGDRVWIGGNSTVYPGVIIESPAVVLPNSAVNTTVRSGTVVGGVPAVEKKKLSQAGSRVIFADE